MIGKRSANTHGPLLTRWAKQLAGRLSPQRVISLRILASVHCGQHSPHLWDGDAFPKYVSLVSYWRLALRSRTTPNTFLRFLPSQEGNGAFVSSVGHSRGRASAVVCRVVVAAFLLGSLIASRAAWQRYPHVASPQTQLQVRASHAKWQCSDDPAPAVQTQPAEYAFQRVVCEPCSIPDHHTHLTSALEQSDHNRAPPLAEILFAA